MHTTNHFHNPNYIKTVKLLHVLNIIGSSSGYTWNSFVQDTYNYLSYVVIQHINKINYIN